jgi:predicted LPLAT superfamily acyltransferase
LAVQTAIERYVASLEEYCRSDPWNWFNFYDFWHGAPTTSGPAPPGAASPDEAQGASA